MWSWNGAKDSFTTDVRFICSCRLPPGKFLGWEGENMAFSAPNPFSEPIVHIFTLDPERAVSPLESLPTCNVWRYGRCCHHEKLAGGVLLARCAVSYRRSVGSFALSKACRSTLEIWILNTTRLCGVFPTPFMVAAVPQICPVLHFSCLLWQSTNRDPRCTFQCRNSASQIQSQSKARDCQCCECVYPPKSSYEV